MKTVKEIREIIQQKKPQLQKKFKVKDIALFGSYARGENTRESDVDIMVTFQRPVGFEFFHLAEFLEEILGVKVDLVTRDGIKPNRWKYIKQDLMYV